MKLPARPADARNTLASFWKVLRDEVHPDLRTAGDQAVKALRENRPRGHPEEALLHALTGDSYQLPLRGGILHFLSHYDLAVQFDEIFVRGLYDFRPPRDAEAPVFVDAGANIGLAVIWLKAAHPTARIRAIEPAPDAAATIRANVASFGLEGVEVIEAALGAGSGRVAFNLCDSMPMAASRSPRMAERGREIRTIEVAQIAAAALLDEPVSFLKLDIEGMEYEVIEALAPRLRKARRLFCEFHFGPDLPRALLTRALATLDRNGMDWVIGKAQGDWRQPLAVSNWDASMNLWARPMRRGPKAAAGA